MNNTTAGDRCPPAASAAGCIHQCRVLGVELFAATNALRFRAPEGRLSNELKAALAVYKSEIIRLIRSACPTCGRPVKDKARCWACHDRQCVGCGRPTVSAFIANCFSCGRLLPDSTPYQSDTEPGA
jgi:hypothetical protein